MKYVEKKYLLDRGSVEQNPAIELAKGDTLLVSEESVLQWTEGECHYGVDHCVLFPAFYNGKRAWVKRAAWRARSPYTAYGCTETVIDFEEGVKLLIEHEVFNFPLPESDQH